MNINDQDLLKIDAKLSENAIYTDRKKNNKSELLKD